MAFNADDLPRLKVGLEALLDPMELSKHVAVAAASESPLKPATTLMYVRFVEEKAGVEKLATFLWRCAPNYALSRRRRSELRAQIESAPADDLSLTTLVSDTVRDTFLEFNKAYPHRSSEVGELLAYCIAIDQLGATQLLAKMALKTNNNMPVHGLDGIHGKIENGWITLYFLESKLSGSANSGAKEFAKSVAEFSNNAKQYRREYQLVKDLGNLDALSSSDKKIALDYFDIFNSSDVPLRERYVGVIVYSDLGAFEEVPTVSDEYEPGHYEREFAVAYAKKLEHHQSAARRHIESELGVPEKCQLYFVAVPDVDKLRELVYAALGYVPSPKNTSAKSTEMKSKRRASEKRSATSSKKVTSKGDAK